jgi:hypothetical protein
MVFFSDLNSRVAFFPWNLGSTKEKGFLEKERFFMFSLRVLPAFLGFPNTLSRIFYKTLFPASALRAIEGIKKE